MPIQEQFDNYDTKFNTALRNTSILVIRIRLYLTAYSINLDHLSEELEITFLTKLCPFSVVFVINILHPHHLQNHWINSNYHVLVTGIRVSSDERATLTWKGTQTTAKIIWNKNQLEFTCVAPDRVDSAFFKLWSKEQGGFTITGIKVLTKIKLLFLRYPMYNDHI
jgi:hypothetical protein